MRVFEVMNEGVQTVPPTMLAVDAWELMRRRRIHHLVVKEGAEVVGIVSDRDLGSRRGASLSANLRIAELMTQHVATIEPTDTVRRAANMMRGRTIGCLPVIRKGRLVGIVTVSDLLVLLGRGIDRPSPSGRRNLYHRGPHNVSTS
jgi:CBS domain-containing protein